MANAATGLAESMLRADPSDIDNQRIVPSQLSQLATVYRDRGDGASFLDASRRAIEQLRTFLAQHPDDLLALNNLAESHEERATFFLERDTSIAAAALALEEHRMGISIFERAHRKFPLDTMIASNLASAHVGTGSVLVRLARATEAIAEFRAALDLLATLASNDSANVEYRAYRASTLGLLSDALLRSGDVKQSLAMARSAVALFEGLPGAALDDIEMQYQHGFSHYALGRALAARYPSADKRYASAAAACGSYRKAHSILVGTPGIASRPSRKSTIEQVSLAAEQCTSPDRAVP